MGEWILMAYRCCDLQIFSQIHTAPDTVAVIWKDCIKFLWNYSNDWTKLFPFSRWKFIFLL